MKLAYLFVFKLLLLMGVVSSNQLFAQSVTKDSTQSTVSTLENNLINYQKSNSWEDFLDVHSELVRFYTQNGNINKAKKLLSKLYEIPASVYQQKPTLSIQAKHTKGEFALYEGDISKALEFFEEAYKNAQKLDKSESLSAQQELELNKSMSIALWQSGNLAGARSFAEQSVLIAQNKIGEDSQEVADAYNNFGLILTSQLPENAKEYYQMSQYIYDKLQKENPNNTELTNKLAYTWINLGIILREQESYVLAEGYFKKALNSFETSHNELAKAFVLNNLGQNSFLQNYFQQAEEYEIQALKIYQNNYGQKHPDIATVYNQLGTIYEAKEKFSKALNFYQKAIQTNTLNFESKKINENPLPTDYLNADILLLSLSLKARALERKYNEKTLLLKDLKDAIKTLLVADKLISTIRNLRVNKQDKIALGNRAAEIYETGLRIAYTISEFPLQKQKYKEQAFYFAERNKASVLLAAIADTKAKHFAGIPDSLLEKEKNIQTQIAYFEQQIQSYPISKTTTQDSVLIYLRSELINYQSQAKEFTSILENQYPNYFALKYNTQIADVPKIQAKLDNKTALLLYAQTYNQDNNSQIYTFLITKNKLEINTVAAKDLESDLIYLRNSIEFQSYDDFIEASSLLSNQLLFFDIPSSIQKVVIVPDGNMGKIPFEALFTEQVTDKNTNLENEDYSQLPFLIKKQKVSYSYSATLFIEKNEIRQPKNSSIFLFAPINFQSNALPNLNGTAEEVKQINSLFNQKNVSTSLYTYKKADKSILFSDSLKNYRFIHLATHGKVNEDNPDLSQIFLTNADGSTGSLFASDIYSLQVGAELVMMSACETGLGKTKKGEGIVGLTRAWFYAGADNLTVSLWQVSDEATNKLSTTFYKNNLENIQMNASEKNSFQQIDYSSSLQKAKLSLLESKDFSAPYYWAAFILIGK
ncbi:CHAT domain-containing tetratricopeptide repeat protein [Bernardetia sp. ABR2-2B]|uniref:CHAT domain-containing protein n=1 Tax=Bernardetia sp. ABR2-2B TaxID=3127472 RepID=UPI0030CC8DFA